MVKLKDIPSQDGMRIQSGLLHHADRLHANGAAAARRSEEEEKLAQSTKEVPVVTAVTNINQNPTIDDGWDEEDDEYVISDDKTVGEKGKKHGGNGNR